MIHCEVTISQGEWDRIYGLLNGLADGRAAEAAIAHALNRTAVGARADIVKAIPEKYTTRAGDVRSAVKIKKARFSDLRAEVSSFGAVIELFKFQHSPKEYSLPRPKVGIRVKVRKDQSGARIPGTFLLGSPHGGHIMRRTDSTDKRFMERLYGPAIPSMMQEVLGDEGEQGIQDKAEARLIRELEQNVDYMLNHGGGNRQTWSR